MIPLFNVLCVLFTSFIVTTTRWTTSFRLSPIRCTCTRCLCGAGVQGVQLLLHGGIAHSLPELVAGGKPDPHPADPRPLVRLLLLSAERGWEVPGGLGVPAPTWGVRHAHAQVPGLALLVHPHPHHHRRLAHSWEQCGVSTYSNNFFLNHWKYVVLLLRVSVMF